MKAEMANYTRDYHFMMLSALAYKDEGQILKDIADCKPGSALPPGWEVLKGSGREDERTGFAAVSFVNTQTKEIVIAYRGSEAPFLIGIDWRGPDLAIASPFKAWNPQFQQALEYARDIQHEYGKNYSYSVTGHSLGGGLAQIAGKMYGLDGRTFDAPGVGNVVAAGEFRDYALRSGRPPGGEGVADTFTNYVVNGSLLGKAGPYVGTGEVVRVSGTSGRNPWEVSLRDALFDPLGESAQRHSYARLLDVFERAAKSGKLDQTGLDPTAPAPVFAVATGARNESLAAAPDAARLADATEAQMRELRTRLQEQGVAGPSVENVAAALLSAARVTHNMPRIDDVIVQKSEAGDRVFVLYKPHGDQQPIFRAHVDLLTAANTPSKVSLEPLFLQDDKSRAVREISPVRSV